MNKLHTTRSWEFLGIDSINQCNYLPMDTKSNVIVAMIDTGVWPESKSFNDEGLGPVPPKFKGECTTGQNFTLSNCNRDADGHGTHTASTVAGAIVVNATYPRITVGTARGGATSARLAIYKACWFNLCSDADILAAFDDAINDGVDIISFSIGILVSGSAGNSAFSSTATNVAPWIITVAANSIDREFRVYVYLGNSKILKGFGLNPLKMESYSVLIAGSAAAAPGVTSTNASFCKNNTLDPTLIKGKIVVCGLESFTDDRSAKAVVIRQGGGVGMILIDPLVKHVSFQNPIATIKLTSTVLFTKPAPQMAVFSSMGPNIITPDIIKPDITAPGLNILAAWSPVSTTTTGGRNVDFNIISGTSMSCPHVSAVAAIIKSVHPSWSPAAIKSAIMTTATILDNTGKLIERDLQGGTPTTPFDYGSGQINPVAAVDPGLIYDFDSNDIIDFLCSTGSTPSQMVNLTGVVVSCKNPPTPSYDFNYPSIGVSNLSGSLSVHRTVTYYGKGSTVYYSQVDYPSGVKVKVTPNKLEFSQAEEKMSFSIDMTPYKSSNGSFVFGALTWSNGVHRVRSPIAINVLSV
ncbi:hypothetical protein TEA_020407 [Camellia sinensis var. sinensis]|uniref:Peptidase S8/S53 domain-containing protein n=1 Tax=Camellia sinensis var. sinensis TaxID=542762 RepID=A0A4S4CWH1_CAMSN|nr:hypothetical protein TEA_020407 [Camellia sinensis var. sinensis]